MFMEKVTIENKQVNITVSKDDPTKLRYSNLLLLFYNSQIPKGQTYREMKAHLDFIDELEKSHTSDKLEIPKIMVPDLKTKIETFKWPIYNKDIITFSEDLLNIE